MKYHLFAAVTLLTASISVLGSSQGVRANPTANRCNSSTSSMSFHSGGAKQLPWHRLVFVPECQAGLKAPPL